MDIRIFYGVFLPFLGTLLGSACVFFMKKHMNKTLQRSLAGFAAGVMSAASVWSLLLPAMDQSSHMGKLAFIPAAVGFLCGMFFLLILDKIIPHLHVEKDETEGIKGNFKRTSMMVFAVILHNIPEGMAVGVALAGWLSGNTAISMSAALVLSLGIAIQNFPEGAIVSMPLLSNGEKKSKAFMYGLLSGIVEPIGAALTIFFAGFFVPILPYLLSFAAGAMIYVVVEELVPEMSEGSHSNVGTIMFSFGFALMMILDVALG